MATWTKCALCPVDEHIQRTAGSGGTALSPETNWNVEVDSLQCAAPDNLSAVSSCCWQSTVSGAGKPENRAVSATLSSARPHMQSPCSYAHVKQSQIPGLSASGNLGPMEHHCSQAGRVTQKPYYKEYASAQSNAALFRTSQSKPPCVSKQLPAEAAPSQYVI